MLRPEIALELKRRRPLHRVPVGHRARPVVLAAVLRDGNDLAHAPYDCLTDRAVVLAAVGNAGGALKHALDRERYDTEIVCAAVRSCADALAAVPAVLRAERPVAEAAAAHGVLLDEFADDAAVVRAAVAACGHAILKASARLRADRDVVLAACTAREHPQPVPEAFAADREVALTAVRHRPAALAGVAPHFQRDQEFLAAATAPRAGAHDNALRRTLADALADVTDARLACRILGIVGWPAYVLLPEALRRTHVGLAAKALRATGVYALHPQLLAAHASLLRLVRVDGRVLRRAPPAYQADAAIARAAVKRHGLAFCHASEELRGDPALLKAALADARLTEDDAREVVGRATDANAASRDVWTSEAGLSRLLDVVHTDARVPQDAAVVHLAVAVALRLRRRVPADVAAHLLARFEGDAPLLECLGKLGIQGRVVVPTSNRAYRRGAVWRTRFALRHLEGAADDRELVLCAVRRDFRALELAAAALRDDRSIVEEAVANVGHALAYASAALRDEESVVLRAGPAGFRHASARLRACAPFARAVLLGRGFIPPCAVEALPAAVVGQLVGELLAQQPCLFSSFGRAVRGDPAHARPAVLQCPDLYKWVTEPASADADLAIRACEGAAGRVAYLRVPQALLDTDRAVAEAMARADWRVFRARCAAFHADRAIVLEAARAARRACAAPFLLPPDAPLAYDLEVVLAQGCTACLPEVDAEVARLLADGRPAALARAEEWAEHLASLCKVLKRRHAEVRAHAEDLVARVYAPSGPVFARDTAAFKRTWAAAFGADGAPARSDGVLGATDTGVASMDLDALLSGDRTRPR
jgi:hypothetical protein